MRLFTLLTWVLTAGSLLGVILNIKKKQACFIIWLFTNVSWCVVDFVRGIYAQSVLFAVYVALAVWGIVEWKKK